MARRPARAWTDLGRLWAAGFVIALIGALGATLIFKLPFGQVVDVILAAQVAFLALAEVWFVLQLLLDLGAGRRPGPRVAAIVATLFLLAPILLALYGLAWFRGQDLAAGSEVYTGVRGGLDAAFKLPAQLGSAAIVAATHGGGYVSYVSRIESVLEAVYYAIGILISIPALWAVLTGRRQGGQAQTAPS